MDPDLVTKFDVNVLRKCVHAAMRDKPSLREQLLQHHGKELGCLQSERADNVT
jgi:hypothetical protein